MLTLLVEQYWPCPISFFGHESLMVWLMEADCFGGEMSEEVQSIEMYNVI